MWNFMGLLWNFSVWFQIGKLLTSCKRRSTTKFNCRHFCTSIPQTKSNQLRSTFPLLWLISFSSCPSWRKLSNDLYSIMMQQCIFNRISLIDTFCFLIGRDKSRLCLSECTLSSDSDSDWEWTYFLSDRKFLFSRIVQMSAEVMDSSSPVKG